MCRNSEEPESQRNRRGIHFPVLAHLNIQGSQLKEVLSFSHAKSAFFDKRNFYSL